MLNSADMSKDRAYTLLSGYAQRGTDALKKTPRFSKGKLYMEKESDSNNELNKYGVWIKTPPHNEKNEIEELLNSDEEFQSEENDVIAELPDFSFLEKVAQKEETSPEENFKDTDVPQNSDISDDFVIEDDASIPMETEEPGGIAERISEGKSEAPAEANSIPDGEISLDDFLGDSAPSTDGDVSINDFLGSSPAQANGEADNFIPDGEISLDAFFDLGDISSSPSEQAQEEQTYDEPLDIDLTFDDSITVESEEDDGFDDLMDSLADTDSSFSAPDGTDQVDLASFFSDDAPVTPPAEEKKPKTVSLEETTEAVSADDFDSLFSDSNQTSGSGNSNSSAPSAETESIDLSDFGIDVDAGDSGGTGAQGSSRAKEKQEYDLKVSSDDEDEGATAEGIGQETNDDDNIEIFMDEKAMNAGTKKKESENEFSAASDDFDLDSLLDSIEDESGQKVSIEDSPAPSGVSATEDSIVTEEPSFEEPAVIEETSVAEETAVAEDKTFQEGITAESEPPSSEEPTVTEETATMEIPPVTEEPSLEKPAVTEAPSVAEETAVAEDKTLQEDITAESEPSSSEEPAVTEETATMEIPPATEEPSFEEPAVTDEAPISEETIVDGTPATEEPAVTESPADADVPAAADESPVNEEPAFEEPSEFRMPTFEEANEANETSEDDSIDISSFLGSDTFEDPIDAMVQKELKVLAQEQENSAKDIDESENSVENSNIIEYGETESQVMGEENMDNAISDNNALLSQIVEDLKEVKNEISNLKSEFEEFKRKGSASNSDLNQKSVEQPSEDKDAGFFGGEDDDDTIALSGDELSNILSSAEMTAEDSDGEAEIQGDITRTAPEEESISESSSFEEPEVVEETQDNVKTEEDILGSVENTPEIPQDYIQEGEAEFPEESLEEPNLESTELDLREEEIDVPKSDDILVESSSSDFMENAIAEENPAPAPEFTEEPDFAEPVIGEEELKAEAEENAEAAAEETAAGETTSEMDEIIETIHQENVEKSKVVPEVYSESEDTTSPLEEPVAPQTNEPAKEIDVEALRNEALEEFDEPEIAEVESESTEAENTVVEDIITDGSDAEESESAQVEYIPATDAPPAFEEEKEAELTESNIDFLKEDEDENLETGISEEPVSKVFNSWDNADSQEEEPTVIEDVASSEPAAEETAGDVAEEAAIETESVPEAEADIPAADSLSGQEVQAAESGLASAAEQASQAAEETKEEIPEELKEEIKTVLSYMDQLLENLPEEKIEEFAKSEQFATYKKLFKELGLS